MGVGERVADVDEDVEQPSQGVILLSDLWAFPQLVEHLSETAALDHLHREEQSLLSIHAQLVDRHDVGGLELPSDLRFLDETSLLLRVARAEDVLDRHFAANVAVDGAENGAHAAAGNLVIDDIALTFNGRPGEQFLD